MNELDSSAIIRDLEMLLDQLYYWAKRARESIRRSLPSVARRSILSFPPRPVSSSPPRGTHIV